MTSLEDIAPLKEFTLNSRCTTCGAEPGDYCVYVHPQHWGDKSRFWRMSQQKQHEVLSRAGKRTQTFHNARYEAGKEWRLQVWKDIQKQFNRQQELFPDSSGCQRQMTYYTQADVDTAYKRGREDFLKSLVEGVDIELKPGRLTLYGVNIDSGAHRE